MSAADHERALPRRTSYGRNAAQIFKRDFFTNRHLADFLRKAVGDNVRPNLRVLDFGCGEQPFRAEIESLGASYYSMDMVQNAAGTVDFVGRLEDYEPREPQFDVILCSEVLEHTEAPGEIVRILAALLREGGKIIISTPFVHGLHEEPHDYSRLTPHFFSQAAAQNGLEVASAEKLGSNLECAITALGFFLYSVAPGNALWKPVRVTLTGLANTAGRALGAVPALNNNRLMYLCNAVVLSKPARQPGENPATSPTT